RRMRVAGPNLAELENRFPELDEGGLAKPVSGFSFELRYYKRQVDIRNVAQAVSGDIEQPAEAGAKAMQCRQGKTTHQAHQPEKYRDVPAHGLPRGLKQNCSCSTAGPPSSIRSEETMIPWGGDDCLDPARARGARRGVGRNGGADRCRAAGAG